jgi:hypothetical protein
VARASGSDRVLEHGRGMGMDCQAICEVLCCSVREKPEMGEACIEVPWPEETSSGLTGARKRDRRYRLFPDGPTRGGSADLQES